MIIFSSVSKNFGDEKTAIDHFSLQINDGDFLVITGPSGAGKTTLMKLLIREYEPSEGEIEFDGEKINQLKKSHIPELRRKIGVVFQDYKLIKDMNVWENIALPLYIQGKKDREIEERVTDLLNLVNLSDKALLFPNQLSGGEAQRVSIARALATGPKVIFADEPTGNLDAEASLMITKLLQKINKLGTTLLFATHDNLVLQTLAKEKIIHLKKENETKANEKKETSEETEIEKLKNKHQTSKKIDLETENKDKKDKKKDKKEKKDKESL